MEECDFVTEIKPKILYKNINTMNKMKGKPIVNKARTLDQSTCFFGWMRYNN